MSVVTLVAMFFLLHNITKNVSEDYAKLYAANTSRALSSYLNKEVAIMSKAAGAHAIIEWFTDEENEEKKTAAYKEMQETITALSNDNIYLGIQESLHEYSVMESSAIEDVKPYSVMKPGFYDDEWYFDCVASDKKYLVNVDIDKIQNRKLVWLNFKVTNDGVPVGAICTGMEFSQRTEELFSGYDDSKIRGLIIDKKGLVYMDSIEHDSSEFLHYASADYVESDVADQNFSNAFSDYLSSIEGYFELDSEPVALKLASGNYDYATIAPIGFTDWSVVTLYKASSLFNFAKLLPLFAILLILFVVFVMVTNIMSSRLIFRPLENLVDSLEKMREENDESVYGAEREDEFGKLSKTIQDLFHKAHYDALTGIYNRRYMEKNLHSIMETLSRAGSILSVLMLDIDFFKNYNDTYGHDMGDKCIKSVAGVLADSITRTDDFTARYGGEEFIVILPNTDRYGACIIAEKIRQNIQKLEISHIENTASSFVTASLGVTTGKVIYTQSWEDYVRKADEALYISKEEGRNRVTYLDLKEE